MKLYEELSSPYHGLTPPELHIEWLAERCAITHAGRWQIKQRCGHFEEMKSAKAARHSMAQWIGVAHRVTKSDIDKFMDGEAPVVRDGMKVPTSSAPFIRVFDHVFVNTWRPDSVMKPDDTALRDPTLRPWLETFLRMIREALCGKNDEKSLDEMIHIIAGNDPEEIAFRFTMHWLAAPLQEIGLNLQTNLWHCGEVGGMGKGTLATAMGWIYGLSNFCLFNQDEAKQGGWNDSLAGALFINWNEVSQGDGVKFDCNSFIKSNTTDSIMQVRKRNIDSYPVLNFGNYYFTGNRESCPWGALDYNDRRNAIFACNDDRTKLTLAKAIREFMDQQPDRAQQMLRGFLYLLRHIKVDHQMLAFAPETEIKREMQDAASSEIDGQWWLENDDAYPRDQWLHAKAYMPHYKRFMDQDKITPRRFSASVLGRLARKGFIERRKQYKSSRYEFLISSDRYPTSDYNNRPKNGTLALVPPVRRRA